MGNITRTDVVKKEKKEKKKGVQRDTYTLEGTKKMPLFSFFHFTSLA